MTIAGLKPQAARALSAVEIEDHLGDVAHADLFLLGGRETGEGTFYLSNIAAQKFNHAVLIGTNTSRNNQAETCAADRNGEGAGDDVAGIERDVYRLLLSRDRTVCKSGHSHDLSVDEVG